MNQAIGSIQFSQHACNCTGACLRGEGCAAMYRAGMPSLSPSEVPPGKTVVGTCSLCRGPVCVHTIWGATVPDTPTCARCGATEKREHQYGPVIPMEKRG